MRKHKYLTNINNRKGYEVTQLVKALRYKPEVAGSIPDVIRIFHWINPAGRTMAFNRNEY